MFETCSLLINDSQSSQGKSAIKSPIENPAILNTKNPRRSSACLAAQCRFTERNSMLQKGFRAGFRAENTYWKLLDHTVGRHTRTVIPAEAGIHVTATRGRTEPRFCPAPSHSKSQRRNGLARVGLAAQCRFIKGNPTLQEGSRASCRAEKPY